MRHLNTRWASKTVALLHPKSGVMHYKCGSNDSPVCLSEYRTHDMVKHVSLFGADIPIVTCLACIAQGEFH